MTDKAIVAQSLSPEALEKVLVGGDLNQLTPQERVAYYGAMCERMGIDPVSRPFQYIKLQGRLTLYATRDATDQIRKRDGISITITSREKIGDVYVVTAQASTPDGRTDESTGAVSIANTKGEALANAYMKAETKAKRRVTLSFAGLGMSDETEVETIPGAESVPTADVEAEEPADEWREKYAERIREHVKAIQAAGHEPNLLINADLDEWFETASKAQMEAAGKKLGMQRAEIENDSEVEVDTEDVTTSALLGGAA